MTSRIRHYLDHNATSPLHVAARAAMHDALDYHGNASSMHGEGRRARGLIDLARDQVAAAVGADPQQIVFTSGGTEANLLALYGLACESGAQRLLVSALEHPSVVTAAQWLATRFGLDYVTVPCDATGCVDPDAVLACLDRTTPTLITLMAAQNETGAIQPIAALTALLRAHPNPVLRVHCDAVQAFGRVPVDMATLGVDALTLSAHKAGGPLGIGAVILAAERDPPALMGGGGQEYRRRGGTENVVAISGFGALAACFGAADHWEHMAAVGALRDGAIRRLKRSRPDVMIMASSVARLPNTLCLALATGPDAATQLIALDLAGFAVSAGAACSSGRVTSSPALEAMGLDSAYCIRALRVSLGALTEATAVDAFITAWLDLTGPQSRPQHDLAGIDFAAATPRAVPFFVSP